MPRKPNLETKLKEIRTQELERETERRAGVLGLPYLNLAGMPIQQDALLFFPEEKARAGEFIPVAKTDKKFELATTNPENALLLGAISELKTAGFSVTLFFISHNSLALGLEHYQKLAPPPSPITGVVKLSGERIQYFTERIRNLKNTIDLLKTMDVSRITEGLEIIFASAIELDASDIHLEPTTEGGKLRLRVDGILQDVLVIDRPVSEKIVSRLKVLAELKLNVTQMAQDGRFTIMLGREPVDVRVSSIPTDYGEAVVLRILNPKKLITFDELGLREDLRSAVRKELSKPAGMLLVTGPTGSGKTTTLYAFLKKLATPEKKVVTIEDPIEYRIKGISQTQVDPKKQYTFANGLRAILRQDPDVILVGEIRDKETAEVALHAALTGHLVFSTLHTNDAAGTIPRLIDMGIRPSIIAPAINLVLAQRLVRRVCPKCAQPETMDAATKRLIEKILKTIPSAVPVPPPTKWKVVRAVGCAFCNESGYRGRFGIFEALLITKKVEALVLKEPAISDLKELAAKEGMTSLQQDGVLKVLAGTTTLQEIERVAGKLEVE